MLWRDPKVGGDGPLAGGQNNDWKHFVGIAGVYLTQDVIGETLLAGAVAGKFLILEKLVEACRQVVDQFSGQKAWASSG